MGYAYDCLIPAAILYNTPGLTREELIGALNNIPAKGIGMKYCGGLEALAHILHLEPRGDYVGDAREFIEIRRNSGLRYSQEFVENIFSENDFSTKKIHYVIYNHREWPSEEFTLQKDSKLEASEIIRKCDLKWLLGGEYLLDNKEKEKFRTFLEKKFSGVRIEKVIDQSKQAGTGILIEQRLIVTAIELYEEKREEYSTLEQLFQAYPQLHPDQRFDWTQERGVLCVTDFDRRQLYWFKKDERYYFDEQHARLVLTGSKYPGENWVDLILTAEAVKKQFWKLLEYRGLQHEYEFFIQPPDVLRAYNQARWDSDTSISAKKQNMTNTEFLRFRLEHGGNINETNPERLKTTILACLEKLQKWAEEDKTRCAPGEKVRFKYEFSEEEIERFVTSATK